MARRSVDLNSVGAYSQRSTKPADELAFPSQSKPWLSARTLKELSESKSPALARLVLAAEGRRGGLRGRGAGEVDLLTPQRIRDAVRTASSLSFLLTPQQATALSHYLVTRGDYSEVARRMGIAEGGVKSHVNSALSKISINAPGD